MCYIWYAQIGDKGEIFHAQVKFPKSKHELKQATYFNDNNTGSKYNFLILLLIIFRIQTFL